MATYEPNTGQLFVVKNGEYIKLCDTKDMNLFDTIVPPDNPVIGWVHHGDSVNDVSSNVMIQGYKLAASGYLWYHRKRLDHPEMLVRVYLLTEIWYYEPDGRWMFKIHDELKPGVTRVQYVPFFDGHLPRTYMEFCDAVDRWTMFKCMCGDPQTSEFYALGLEAKLWIRSKNYCLRPWDTSSMDGYFKPFIDQVVKCQEKMCTGGFTLEKEKKEVEEKKTNKVLGIMKIVTDKYGYIAKVPVTAESSSTGTIKFTFDWSKLPDDKKPGKAYEVDQVVRIGYADAKCYTTFCEKVADKHCFDPLNFKMGPGNCNEYYRMLHDLGVREWTNEDKIIGIDKYATRICTGWFECSDTMGIHFNLPFSIYEDEGKNSGLYMTVHGSDSEHIEDREVLLPTTLSTLTILLDQKRRAGEMAYKICNTEDNGAELKKAWDAWKRIDAEKQEEKKDMNTFELNDVKMICKKCADVRSKQLLPATHLATITKVTSYLTEYDRIQVKCPHCGQEYELMIKSSQMATLTPRDIQGKIYMASNGELVPKDFYRPERVTAVPVVQRIPFATKVVKPLNYEELVEEIIFNDPATIVKWKDGSETVVQARDGEKFDPEKGLAMAISKKALGNKRDYYITFLKALKKFKKDEKKKAEAKAKKVEAKAKKAEKKAEAEAKAKKATAQAKKSTKKKESSKKEA